MPSQRRRTEHSRRILLLVSMYSPLSEEKQTNDLEIPKTGYDIWVIAVNNQYGKKYMRSQLAYILQKRRVEVQP
jgi:hypothetical protein